MISVVSITTENSKNYLEHILEIENLPFPSPWSLKTFKAETRNPISQLRALMVDGVLSGYICFWMYDIEIQLMNLAVHPHKRNKGYGYYLLTKMIEAGISNRVQSIWLEVRPSNLVARRLYQKLGFEAVGRRPRYYTDTHEDAIIMALTFSFDSFFWQHQEA